MLHFSSIYASIFDLTLLFSQCVLHALIEMCEYYVMCSVFVCGCVCVILYMCMCLCVGEESGCLLFFPLPNMNSWFSCCYVIIRMHYYYYFCCFFIRKPALCYSNDICCTFSIIITITLIPFCLMHASALCLSPLWAAVE